MILPALGAAELKFERDHGVVDWVYGVTKVHVAIAPLNLEIIDIHRDGFTENIFHIHNRVEKDIALFRLIAGVFVHKLCGFHSKSEEAVLHCVADTALRISVNRFDGLHAIAS